MNVESQREWESICARLFSLGLVELEILSETVTFQGAPVYNGAFGVHKKWVDGKRILRLIINLVPTNALQQQFKGESRRMGYPGLWPHLVLYDDEAMMFYSEDQRACFHMYRVPAAWRSYFVLGKSVSPAARLPDGPPIRVRATACPMGWINAADFIQEAHMRLLCKTGSGGAGFPERAFVRMGVPYPNLGEPTPRSWYSCYVDNWGHGKIVFRTELDEYRFKPSWEHISVRSAYEGSGIERDPKKACEGSLIWETLGAELRGL